MTKKGGQKVDIFIKKNDTILYNDCLTYDTFSILFLSA